jgi:hypothetical protein
MVNSAEIEVFVSRYSPEIAAQLRSARAQLRKLIPKGYELVYDSHNALVFAFGPTPRASELVVSIAGYPQWVTLFFAKGTALEDPEGLLEGSGPAMRSVRLVPFGALKSRPVQRLIKQALAAQVSTFKRAPPLTTVVQAISAKKRPRRPA